MEKFFVRIVFLYSSTTLIRVAPKNKLKSIRDFFERFAFMTFVMIDTAHGRHNKKHRLYT